MLWLKNKSTALVPFLLFIIIALNLAGCDEDSNPVKDPSPHFEAVGIILLESGVEIFRYFKGNISDTLKSPIGLTPHWKIKFLDDNQNTLEAPSDADKSFGWDIQDSSVLGVWQHPGEEGSFELHLRGKKSGLTHIKFQVLHNGHVDFTTQYIPVLVQGIGHDEPIGVILKDEAALSEIARAPLAGNGVSTGSINVKKDSTTEHIEAVFYDINLIEFQPDVPPHSLRVECSDTTVVKIVDILPGEPWAFKIFGKSEGTANLIIHILHNGAIGKTFAPITARVDP